MSGRLGEGDGAVGRTKMMHPVDPRSERWRRRRRMEKRCIGESRASSERSLEGRVIPLGGQRSARTMATDLPDRSAQCRWRGTHGAAMRRKFWVILLVGCLSLCGVKPAAAQIYAFDDAEVPRPRGGASLYAFFVFSKEDSPSELHRNATSYVKFHEIHRKSPTGGGGSADGGGGTAEQTGAFSAPAPGSAQQGLSAVGKGKAVGKAVDLVARPGSAESASYHGIQLTLIRWKDYLDFVDEADFCCVESDGKKCERDTLKYRGLPKGMKTPPSAITLDVPSAEEVSKGQLKDIRQDITETGTAVMCLYFFLSFSVKCLVVGRILRALHPVASEHFVGPFSAGARTTGLS